MVEEKKKEKAPKLADPVASSIDVASQEMIMNWELKQFLIEL